MCPALMIDLTGHFGHFAKYCRISNPFDLSWGAIYPVIWPDIFFIMFWLSMINTQCFELPPEIKNLSFLLFPGAEFFRRAKLKIRKMVRRKLFRKSGIYPHL